MAAIGFLAERMRLGFGVDLMVDQLATGLAGRGHDVTVFTCFSDGTYEGGAYRLVPLPVPSHPEALVWDRRARSVALGTGLYDLAVDLWFAFTPPYFSLLPRLRGRGVAVDCGVSDWSGMPSRQRRNFRTTELLQQQVYFRSAARVVTISRWLQGQLPGALRARSRAILLGADHYPIAGPDARAAARARLGVADDDVLSLYVGRLNPHHQPYKGTEKLLRMHREMSTVHPRTRLAMVGFGYDADAEWVRSNGGLPVVNAPVEEMPSLLAAADLYVTASSWEGFDLPLVEAQRSGRPVVAFRAGAHAEVVDDGSSGFLVDDDGGFVAALTRLVGDAALRRRMSGAAAEWGARFRWADAVESYDALVEEVLGEVGRVLPGASRAVASPATARPSSNGSARPPTANGSAGRRAPRAPAVTGPCAAHPPVSALILHYNADAATLTRCVASVLASRCRNLLEVVVADNGSTRNLAALDEAAALDGRVKVVRLGRNHGFAGGINRGLAVCRGGWVLILNNDTEVEPDALDAAAAVLAAEGPDCVAAVPKLLLSAHDGVIDAIGNAVDGMGRAFNVGIGQVDVGQYDSPMRVFGPCFAAALFRREAFDVSMVGPLDDSYFMYYEDVDWSWRANLLGYRFQTAPAARVRHDHSKTTREQPNEFKVRQIHGHLLTTVVKNMPARTAARVSAGHVAAHLRAVAARQAPVGRLRLVAGAVLRLPEAVPKHRWLRKRRAVPDEAVLALAPQGEGCFYDSEAYEPVLGLANLAAAYSRKARVTGDGRWGEVADRAAWFARRGVEPGLLRRHLLPLLDGEPAAVHDLISRLDP